MMIPDQKPEVDSSAYLAPGAQVNGDVCVRANASIWHNAVLRGDAGRIMIGKGSNIQDNCTLHCTQGRNTEIGECVTVGHNAVLHSCTVKDGSLIGMGAIVLDDAIIGTGCLIAAGGVVTPRTVIPDGTLAMGNPARVKRVLSDEEKCGLLENAREYVELAAQYLCKK